jgi:hypothetical protein
MVRQLLKALHEIGAIGTLGSFAACIVLLASSSSESLVARAAVLQGIASIAKWLMVPSLAMVLVSGLLAIAATEAYKNAAWAWVKALLGIGTFDEPGPSDRPAARGAGDQRPHAGGAPPGLAIVRRAAVLFSVAQSRAMG